VNNYSIIDSIIEDSHTADRLEVLFVKRNHQNTDGDKTPQNCQTEFFNNKTPNSSFSELI